MMSNSHFKSNTIGLVVQDKKVYRIIGGDCWCRKKGCQWHKNHIHELYVTIPDESALVGERQESVNALGKQFISICGKPYMMFRIKTSGACFFDAPTRLNPATNIPIPDCPDMLLFFRPDCKISL